MRLCLYIPLTFLYSLASPSLDIDGIVDRISTKRVNVCIGHRPLSKLNSRLGVGSLRKTKQDPIQPFRIAKLAALP